MFPHSPAKLVGKRQAKEKHTNGKTVATSSRPAFLQTQKNKRARKKVGTHGDTTFKWLKQRIFSFCSMLLNAENNIEADTLTLKNYDRNISTSMNDYLRRKNKKHFK